MPDDEPSNNPFVRFKRHVDASIGNTVQGVLSLPTTISRGETTSNSNQDTHEQQHSQSTPEPEHPTEHTSMDIHDTSDREVIDWSTARLWQRFAFYSPYSPLNLRHLPQPIPNDLPSDVDPDTFTFEDAFEDLLSEASGRQMMDLRRRSEARQLLREMFPQGEPGFFWLRRLQAQGLLTSHYHRALDRPRLEWERPRSMEEWVERRRQELLKDWEDATTEPPTKDAHSRPSWSDWFDRDITINFGDMVRKADRAFKDLAHAINEASQDNPSTAETSKDRSSSGLTKKEPETEDDLFSVISSAFSEADKSLSTFFKSFVDGSFKTNVSTSFQKSETYSEGVPENSGSNRTVKSVEEHVDEYGNLHTKTEIKTLNADGQEVGRETHYSIKHVSQSQYPRGAESDAQETEQTTESVDSQKPSGWFWK